MRRGITAILIFSFSLGVSAQRTSIEEYVEQFRDIAMHEMKRSGVPAAITLAQGILESESGNSELVKRSNNHFGIKCKSTWAGDSVNHDDDAVGECFRAYSDASESYRDHSNFLRGNQRYASLFRLDPEDYRGWANGLKRAGYATNPRYPEQLIKYIEQYNLQQYTLLVLNDVPPSDIAKRNAENENIPATAGVKDESPVVTDETIVLAGDPGRIITINKIKCVFVNKGTSLLALATRHNINLKKLMEYNDLAEEGILKKDQYIFLQKKAKTGEKEYHIVQPGETVHDVAQKNGIQLQYLRAYNDLEQIEAMPANTKLFLQPGFKGAGANGPKVKTHTVEPKEGLYAIARKYNVTVQQLKDWNKLEGNGLKIGQEIIVSK
ncbi:MAG: LysM peptidoglycan-binding domain-containing protein [Ferruginibacter sp.]|nr:LysM peptidoglycan-binding domain-containing protein [Chitinophagaceae bacterium]MBP6285715.1 LysM peptidoglycan-binding domain-containing protein [Ferruginibacter sp.]MBU9936167.1 LysM peptidoglycan-binding domain-containing protein [Ferruginibacter sp.]HQY12759.1 LysM peptidoglycan-binding domain-containing protein [Ferruginibacter sp.]